MSSLEHAERHSTPLLDTPIKTIAKLDAPSPAVAFGVVEDAEGKAQPAIILVATGFPQITTLLVEMLAEKAGFALAFGYGSYVREMAEEAGIDVDAIDGDFTDLGGEG